MRLWTKNPGVATRLALLVCLAGGAAAGCGPATGAGKGPGVVPLSTALLQGQRGYQLAIQAAACWYGPQWSEAEGVAPPLRQLATERRCSEVAREIFGDTSRLTAFKNLEPAEVEATVQRIVKDGEGDGPMLGRVFSAVAVAEREALTARRSSERVGRGRGQAQAGQDAIAALRAHDALAQLVKGDFGDYSGDARALGLLVAINRLSTAWALPRDLKIYAVDSVGEVLFDIKLPEDALTPAADGKLRDGLLTEHLVTLSQSAGLAVPAELKPRERRMLAWQGVHKALADRLGKQKLSRNAEPSLKPVVNAQIERLTSEYQDARKLLKLQ